MSCFAEVWVIGRRRVPAPPERISPFRASIRRCTLLRRLIMRPAIYIPHHHGTELLGRALGGLRAQSRPTDVVVVDNGSTDGSREMVREEFPEVELLQHGRNLGFGPALNLSLI